MFFRGLVVPLSRCPVVPLSRCLVVPSSRCPVVPLSRCLVVSSSRRPVVSLSRRLVVPSSCWRASQSFPVILRRSQSFSANRAPPSRPQSMARHPVNRAPLSSLVVPLSRCLVVPWSRGPVVSSSRHLVGALPSHSQSFSGVLRRSQSFPVNRAPPSQSRAPSAVSSSRRPAIPQSFTALPNLPKFSNLPKFPLSFFNFFALQKYVKSQTINQITLSPKKKISHIFVYVEK